MPDLQIVSADQLPARTSRRSKTSPLREKILALTPEGIIPLVYWSEDYPEGYKSSTVAQVAGRLSKDNDKYRYSIQSNVFDVDGEKRKGCYITCKPKNNV